MLLPGIDFAAGDIVVPGTGVTLEVDTAFPAGSVLNFDVPLKGATLAAGTRLPVAATLKQPMVLPAGTVLAAAVHDAQGNLLFAAGTLLASTKTLEAGTVLGAGSLLGSSTTIGNLIWPKGVALPDIEGASNSLTNVLRLSSALALSVGSKIPSGTDIKLPTGVESVQLRPEVAGSNWAIAPMLAEGSQSWSLRLVAGADTQAADSRVVRPVLAGGDLHLADSHYGMFGKAGAGGWCGLRKGRKTSEIRVWQANSLILRTLPIQGCVRIPRRFAKPVAALSGRRKGRKTMGFQTSWVNRLISKTLPILGCVTTPRRFAKLLGKRNTRQAANVGV